MFSRKCNLIHLETNVFSDQVQMLLGISYVSMQKVCGYYTYCAFCSESLKGQVLKHWEFGCVFCFRLPDRDAQPIKSRHISQDLPNTKNTSFLRNLGKGHLAYTSKLPSLAFDLFFFLTFQSSMIFFYSLIYLSNHLELNLNCIPY